jgi:hypothetical protein
VLVRAGATFSERSTVRVHPMTVTVKSAYPMPTRGSVLSIAPPPR